MGAWRAHDGLRKVVFTLQRKEHHGACRGAKRLQLQIKIYSEKAAKCSKCFTRLAGSAAAIHFLLWNPLHLGTGREIAASAWPGFRVLRCVQLRRPKKILLLLARYE